MVPLKYVSIKELLLKTTVKRTINWNKYQSNILTQRSNKYLDYLVDPSFQGVTRFFVSSFENNAHQTSYKRTFLLTVETKDYNIMIHGKNFFNQPVKIKSRTFDST